MKILYAASEATPYAKSGGLADVAGSLPKALVKMCIRDSTKRKARSSLWPLWKWTGKRLPVSA